MPVSITINWNTEGDKSTIIIPPHDKSIEIKLPTQVMDKVTITELAPDLLDF